VIMPGKPEVGLAYRQEHYAGEAEDAGEILSLDDAGGGALRRVRRRPHDEGLDAARARPPRAKVYAKGISPVLVLAVSGGSDREELLTFRRGG
jgi:hypothetical protein